MSTNCKENILRFDLYNSCTTTIIYSGAGYIGLHLRWLHWFTLDRLLPAGCGGHVNSNLGCCRRITVSVHLPWESHGQFLWISVVFFNDFSFANRWEASMSTCGYCMSPTVNSDTSCTVFFESVNSDTFGLIFQKSCIPMLKFANKNEKKVCNSPQGILDQL